MITKRPASTLFDAMNECNKTGKHRTAIIVFRQDNWPDHKYTETERSYASYSGQWGWDYDKMGRCIIGNCLDGKDLGARLDHYNWNIEYWYWKDEAQDVTLTYLTADYDENDEFCLVPESVKCGTVAEAIAMREALMTEGCNYKITINY